MADKLSELAQDDAIAAFAQENDNDNGNDNTVDDLVDELVDAVADEIQPQYTLQSSVDIDEKNESYDQFEIQPLSTSEWNVGTAGTPDPSNLSPDDALDNAYEHKTDGKSGKNGLKKFNTRKRLSFLRRKSGSKSKSKSRTRTRTKSKTKSPAEFLKKTVSDVFLRRRSALPSMAKHCRFEWNEIDVYVGNGADGKQILHNFNGVVNSGELLAVMGGSGAGKSTLLNALSGRTDLTSQYIEGELAINGKKFAVSDQRLMQSLCTYVPQSDVLCATQTVEEALSFYAQLKLSHHDPAKQQKRIDYLIDVLHLEKCRKNYIGDEKKRGISGGEKRRVSIAAEILNDADIIFLDEPTSGLDAYTAARTIKTLKQFSTVSNKIIIATIHQPSIEVFYLFDKLILLSNGKCCYNAITENVSTYFKNELKPRTNPADVILFEVQRNSDQFCERWSKSKINRLNMGIDTKKKWEKYDEMDLDMVKNYEVSIRNNLNRAPLWLQYKLLLTRELQSIYRDRRVTIIRLLQVIFFGLASGLIYYNIERSFEKKVRAFLLLTIIPLLFGIVSSLTAFPKQKVLFTRENNSGTYSASAWAISFMIIEIPREIIHMTIFTAIAYYLIGLEGDFTHYCITFFLASFSGGSCGILFGSIAKTAVEAAQTVPAALIPLLIFSDGMVSLKNLNQNIQWMAKIDPLYYILRCFYIIEFDGVTYLVDLSSEEEELCETYDNILDDSYHKCVAEVEKIYAQYNFTDSIPENVTADDIIDVIDGGGTDQNMTSPIDIIGGGGSTGGGGTGGNSPSSGAGGGIGGGLFTPTMAPTTYEPTFNLFESTTLVPTMSPTTPDPTMDTLMPTLFPTLAPTLNDSAQAQSSCKNITTPSEDDSATLDEFCYGEYTGASFFRRKELESGGYINYWIYIIIICFVIRLLAIILLVVINRNGFSWLKNKIKNFCCCCCILICSDHDDNDKKRQNMENEIEMQSNNKTLENTGDHPQPRFNTEYVV